MTVTDKARRSDALYYDDSVMHRRNLCDMVAERESRIEDLEAENAKLRLLIEAMGLYERMETDVDPLRALEIRDAIKQLAGELGLEAQ